MHNEEEKWLDEIRPEDLPEPYGRIAALIGVRHALVLAQEFAGSEVYFRKLDGALCEVRDRKIRGEFNGYNVRELAKKYGLTDRWVRSIVTPGGDPNQRTLFELDPEMPGTGRAS